MLCFKIMLSIKVYYQMVKSHKHTILGKKR